MRWKAVSTKLERSVVLLYLLANLRYATPSIYTPHSSSFFSIRVTFSPPCHLIRRSSRLTRLQLIQIIPTNRQVPLILVHALLETVDLGRTRLRALVVAVHRVLAVVLLGEGLVGGSLGLGFTAAAAEEAADRVADGGADCYATV